MLPKVPVFLHSRRHRLSICMAGGHQQHGAEGVPVRLVGVVGFLIVLRPGGVGLLPRLGDGSQNLVPPVLYRRLNLRRGQLLPIIGRLSIWGNPVEGISIFLSPLLDNGFPVVRVVPGQCSGVDVKSHSDASFLLGQSRSRVVIVLIHLVQQFVVGIKCFHRDCSFPRVCQSRSTLMSNTENLLV